MRVLSTAELLSVWEVSAPLPSAQRALALLSVACADESGSDIEALARLSIGQRDTRLFLLREQVFGSRLGSLAECPACRERLKFEVTVPDLCGPLASIAAEPFLVQQDDYTIDFRLPNSLDLMELDGGTSVAENQRQLLRRCVLAAKKGAALVASDDLPADVAQVISAKMALSDPQADVQLALACPQCSHRWTTTFDILSYFWTELTEWAMRRLREVHALALAYGWSEADILGLSPSRRQSYLEMIRA